MKGLAQTDALVELRRRRLAIAGRVASAREKLVHIEKELRRLALDHVEQQSAAAHRAYALRNAELEDIQCEILAALRAVGYLDQLIGEQELKAEQDRAASQVAEMERTVEARYQQELPGYQRIIAKFRRQGEFGQAAIYERELGRLRDGLREQLTPPVTPPGRQAELRDAADGQRLPQSP